MNAKNENEELPREREGTSGDGGAQATGSGRVEPPASPEPPRGPRVRTLLALLLLVVACLWVGGAWGHALVRPLARAWDAVASREEEPKTEEESRPQFYTCGMHPWVVLPTPGDCPICHMKLTPLDPSKFSGDITIDPVITQNIGVRVAPVVSGPLTRTIRTVGTVDYDETTVRDVNTRFDGWVQKLDVDYVGAKVQAGEPLFDVFSRQLYSAQEEYLLALRGSKAMDGAADFVPAVGEDRTRNLDAARERLLLFGISPEQIDRLERDGKVSTTMTISSPYSGLVTEKKAFEGMQVTPGMMTYRIADLSRVWVFVTLYEYQLPFVHEGQTAEMTLPYIPGQRFEGKVAYVYPWLEEKTRQARVRLEFANPDMLLKPGMFTTVDLTGKLADERTLAPREAIIDTGERSVAFVSRGGGRFEPRQVRMGVQAEDGMVEILSGLRPGELVVTSGQFLLDSEAKIREALGKMIRGEMASDQQRAAIAAGPSELKSLPQGVASDLKSLIAQYLAIGADLSSERPEGIAQAARAIASAVDRLLGRSIPGHPDFWKEHEEVARIRGKALELAGGVTLDEARGRFGDLSVALSELLVATGVPPGFGQEVRELHCPMFREGQGGSIWLQTAGDVKNPYFGRVMPECYDRERSLPVTGEGADTGAEMPADPSAHMAPAGSDAGAGTAGAKAPPARAGIEGVLDSYLAIQALLATDHADGLSARFAELHERAGGLAVGGDPSMQRLADELVAATAEPPADLDAARETFKELSRALVDLLGHAPPAAIGARNLYEVYCPMADARWVQVGNDISNPYFGKVMEDCGNVSRKLGAADAPEGGR